MNLASNSKYSLSFKAVSLGPVAGKCVTSAVASALNSRPWKKSSASFGQMSMYNFLKVDKQLLSWAHYFAKYSLD